MSGHKNFLDRFSHFLDSKRITIELNYKNISLETNAWNANTNLTNCVIIIAKYFILKQKGKTKTYFHQF